MPEQWLLICPSERLSQEGLTTVLMSPGAPLFVSVPLDGPTASASCRGFVVRVGDMDRFLRTLEPLATALVGPNVRRWNLGSISTLDKAVETARNIIAEHSPFHLADA